MRKYLAFHGKFLAQEVKAHGMVWPVVNVELRLNSSLLFT